jgi:hypothetical protein
MDTRDLDLVIEKIKASNAVTLNVELLDGNVRIVAVPTVRRRWARLRASVANIGEWKQIECLDKKGAIITIIANENASASDDDLDVDVGDGDDTARALTPLLSLMLKAQDVALKRNHDLLKAVFDSQGRLLELVSNRLANMEKAFETNLDRTQDYAERWIETMQELAKGNAASGGDPEVAELLKLLPFMLRKTPAPPKAAPPKAAAKPSNGPTPPPTPAG